MRRTLAAVLLLAGCCFGQLTSEQKLQDFRTLTSLYAKQYAPYHWKKEGLGYDAYDLTKWLEKVKASKTDLEFFEVMTKYVAALQDVHSLYTNSSTFKADAGFRVDIYGGKFLIDSINRAQLKTSDYPFEIGDELIAMDGKSPTDLVDEFATYLGFGNPLSQRRYAAILIGARYQDIYPRSVEVGEKTTITVKRKSGATEQYTIAWAKSGFPLINAGPVPGLGLTSEKSAAGSKNSRAEATYFDPRHPLTRYQIMKADMRASLKELRGFRRPKPCLHLSEWLRPKAWTPHDGLLLLRHL